MGASNESVDIGIVSILTVSRMRDLLSVSIGLEVGFLGMVSSKTK